MSSKTIRRCTNNTVDGFAQCVNSTKHNSLMNDSQRYVSKYDSFRSKQRLILQYKQSWMRLGCFVFCLKLNCGVVFGCVFGILVLVASVCIFTIALSACVRAFVGVCVSVCMCVFACVCVCLCAFVCVFFSLDPINLKSFWN